MKVFFTKRVVKHCNSLLREAADPPSPEAFKSPGDVVLRNMV